MMYLGLDRTYDAEHHLIVFARDYKRNIEAITHGGASSEDMSLYIRNSCATDPSGAPPGDSALYILVPVANNTSGIDWQERKQELRDYIFRTLRERTPYGDVRPHIQRELIVTPEDWERKYSVFLGATFNMSHSWNQMLYLRPHNEFEKFSNCYLVGGGTHPGSGLPTIATQLSAGSCAVNDVIRVIANPYAAFGGNRLSGYGRYHGPEGLRAFSRMRTIMLASDRRTREINWFPFTSRTRRQLASLLRFRHEPTGLAARLNRMLLPLLLGAVFRIALPAQPKAQTHLTVDVQLTPDSAWRAGLSRLRLALRISGRPRKSNPPRFSADSPPVRNSCTSIPICRPAPMPSACMRT